MLDNKKLQIKKNKKGQIGETITWVLATIIILFVLGAFIYASVLISEVKSINPERINVKSGENSLDVGWVEVKTFFAYSVNSNNREKIENWIGEVSNEE